MTLYAHAEAPAGALELVVVATTTEIAEAVARMSSGIDVVCVGPCTDLVDKCVDAARVGSGGFRPVFIVSSMESVADIAPLEMRFPQIMLRCRSLIPTATSTSCGGMFSTLDS